MVFPLKACARKHDNLNGLEENCKVKQQQKKLLQPYMYQLETFSVSNVFGHYDI